MGLDIHLYTNISLTDSDDCSFIAYVNDEEFNSRIKNLEYGGRYIGEKSSIKKRCAYSSHGLFRGKLLELIGRSDLTKNKKADYTKVSEGMDIPFIELINFADNEGCIDWQSCGELANDFNEWNDQAQENLEIPWLDLYNDWRDITNECAKNRGVLVFS